MLKDVIKCIFNTFYGAPELEKAYNKYLYLSDYVLDVEHIFDFNYNYIYTLKEIECWNGDICGGEDLDDEHYIILFKGKILIKLISRPLYTDEYREELIADIESDNYGKQKVIINKNGEIKYIEPEYEDEI